MDLGRFGHRGSQRTNVARHVDDADVPVREDAPQELGIAVDDQREAPEGRHEQLARSLRETADVRLERTRAWLSPTLAISSDPTVPPPPKSDGTDPTRRSDPAPDTVPAIVTFCDTAMGDPLAIVSVAPASTTRLRQTGFVTPEVDGLFEVPDGMTTSVTAAGTPPFQLAAVFQFVSTVPFQVLGSGGGPDEEDQEEQGRGRLGT